VSTFWTSLATLRLLLSRHFGQLHFFRRLGGITPMLNQQSAQLNLVATVVNTNGVFDDPICGTRAALA
jgi:hypothetical protein